MNRAISIVPIIALLLGAIPSAFAQIQSTSAAPHLPTIHCWDGTSIDPVNGTYVAHCSPAPVCPHGTSAYPDGTCLPPCGGSGNMSCMFKLFNDTQATIGEQFVFKTSLYTDYVFNYGQTICAQQGFDCYAEGLADGSAHAGMICATLYNNQSKQQQYCSGYRDGSSNPAKYDSTGAIVCDNENNMGCHWDMNTMGGFPCVHGPPYIPDKNGNCPLPMFMRSPTSPTIASNHSLVSCGQIMCYDLGWNRGQNTVDQHCPAALQLPESVDNATIVNIEQIKAYCNGFSNGQHAAAAHPGVKSYIGSSMVLPNNATGFSSTVKIKPNGSAVEIGRPTIHTGNDSGVRCDAVNTCYKIGFNDAQKSIYVGCPAGDFTGPVLVNSNTTRIDNETQAYAYCTGFTDGSARPA